MESYNTVFWVWHLCHQSAESLFWKLCSFPLVSPEDNKVHCLNSLGIPKESINSLIPCPWLLGFAWLRKLLIFWDDAIKYFRVNLRLDRGPWAICSTALSPTIGDVGSRLALGSTLSKSIYYVSYQPMSKPQASWKTGVCVRACVQSGRLHVTESF